ncbi:insulinase family protein [Paenibacillus sp. UMB7766-LJ446]|uniref:M16 family metallopeptidase n=1 Tax=Paenibacillus sp. UMB7766-LJ446 TaxID=3046313 RepID=UPI0025519E41|nr:insulinase family protein [Paenibacillus sp. UMB7766-LJ446]MDK8193019.1 insulinase family protein [Paenibacillus sp. UMB7766-LJ446]
MQSFITEQRNQLSVHVMPTRQFASRYIHLSIVNEQGRIPAAVFMVIVRLLLNPYPGLLDKRQLRQHLWSLYADEPECNFEYKGDAQLASIRLRTPGGVLPLPEVRTEEVLELLAELMLWPVSNGEFDEMQVQEEIRWAEYHAGYDISEWDKVVRGRCLEWLGYAERGRATELEKLRHCVREGELLQWYREVLRCPIHVHVIGDFEPDPMIRLVLSAFQALDEAEVGRDDKRAPIPTREHQTAEPREEGELMMELMDIQQCKINVAFDTGVHYGASNYPALFLFHSLFGASPASRLQCGLREQKQWVYQIYSTLDDYRGTLHVTTGTSSGYATEVLEAIDAEWLKLCSGDIHQRELNRAIQNVMHYVQVGYDLPEQVVTLHLDRLLHQVHMTTPQFLDAIAGVTSEQVAEVASGLKKAVTWILYPESEYSA